MTSIRDETPFASVIIASYNSEKTIRRCLQSLRKQTTKRRFEVFVVDSGNDATADIVRSEFPEVQLIQLEKKTAPGAARNLGIHRARGELLAFIDSDCMADPDWLDQIERSMEEHGVNIVYGALKNGTPWHPVGTTAFYIEFNEFLPGSPKHFSTIFLGGNLGIRKSVFERHGVYYNDFVASEDTLLAWELTQRGEKILFDPRIRVTHINRTQLLPMLRHQVMLGWYSGRARRESNLYGRLLVRWRGLCLLLPLIRWLRASARIVRASVWDYVKFVSIMPLYFLASAFWSYGFMKGIQDSPVPANSQAGIQQEEQVAVK